VAGLAEASDWLTGAVEVAEPGVASGFLACAASAGIVKAADGLDGAPFPAEFVATTVKVYVLDGASAGIEQLVDELEQVSPPGLAVAVYPVIAAPPVDDGADHLTVAAVSAADAATPDGGPGTVILVKVVTCSEFVKFVPWSIAQTLIVYVVPAERSRRSTAWIYRLGAVPPDTYVTPEPPGQLPEATVRPSPVTAYPNDRPLNRTSGPPPLSAKPIPNWIWFSLTADGSGAPVAPLITQALIPLTSAWAGGATTTSAMHAKAQALILPMNLIRPPSVAALVFCSHDDPRTGRRRGRGSLSPTSPTTPGRPTRPRDHRP
jgi:hypothetical protein